MLNKNEIRSLEEPLYPKLFRTYHIFIVDSFEEFDGEGEVEIEELCGLLFPFNSRISAGLRIRLIFT